MVTYIWNDGPPGTNVKLDLYRENDIYIAGDSNAGWYVMIDTVSGATTFGMLNWIHSQAGNFLFGDLSVRTIGREGWRWLKHYGYPITYGRSYCNPPYAPPYLK